MAPNRKGDLASIAFRALCSGTVACFMTACLAGNTSLASFFIDSYFGKI